MKELFIVGIVYAPYQVSVNVYAVWAQNAKKAMFLAEMYQGEGKALDPQEYDIDVTALHTFSDLDVQRFDSKRGWIGKGKNPVEQVFHWSRG